MSGEDARTRRRRVEELTLRLLDDDEATEVEIEELARLLEEDEVLARVYLDLLEQEAVLRGERRGLDLTEPTMARLRAGASSREQRIERAVMDRIRGPRRLEPRWPWLGAARFWKVTAAAAALLVVAVGAHTDWYMHREATPQEAFLYGQAQIVPGQPSAFRVHVRDAARRRPVAGARVQLALHKRGDDDAIVWRAQARSDARGMVLVRPEVAAATPEGDYTLSVKAVSDRGESIIDHQVAIKRSYKVMVTTDKPLYQPGQTIRIRTLSLASSDLRPAAGREVLIQIKDGKENKVFKQAVKTSRFGIAAAELRLADQVNQGRYIISATLGDTESLKNVAVKRYRLPKFRVELQADRAFYGPGDVVRGTLAARYTFGQPVARAQVVLQALEQVERLNPFFSISGVTDAAGRLAFEVPLESFHVGQPLKQGDAVIFLEAKVSDPAHHTQRKSLELTVTSRPIRVELLPEGGRLVRNVENTVYVVTAYPDGRPAQTELVIDGRRLRTSRLGVATLTLRPTAGALRVRVQARDGQGRQIETRRELRVNQHSEAFLLRTDRAIYKAGETVRLGVLSPGGRGRVFVDVIRDQRTLLVQAIDLKDGRGALALDLPAGAFGTLQLHAYRILASGELVSDTRLIQVLRPDRLRIAAELDRASYRPAEKAVLKLAVRRASGEPVAAAISLAGVDEAVFALHELRPGLARVYFNLQQELLKPRYELHAHAPYSAEAALTQGAPTDPAARQASRALFAAAGGDQQAYGRSASETFVQRLARYHQEEEQRLEDLAAAGVVALALLVVALLLPLILYAGWRIARRGQLQADEPERDSLHRALGSLALWWGLGLYLPVAGLATAAIFIRSELGLVSAVFLGGGGLLACLVLQIRGVLRVRRAPAAQATPLLRKLVTPLPAAYLLAQGAVVCLVAASASHPRLIAEATAVVLALLVIGAALLVCGAITAAGNSLLRPLTTRARLALGWLGRTALMLAPVLLLLVVHIVHFTFTYQKAMGRRILFNKSIYAPMSNRALKQPPGAKQTAGAQVRVRRHFPETLIWRPEIITDERGQATLQIPLADSITTWRLSLSAVSDAGELGAAVKSLRVFQPFFVDVDLPVALTQNDRVQVPVAVYNYLDRAQTVRLELARAPWYRLAGGAAQTVRVGPRQVKGATFTLVALRPGQHKVVLRARGEGTADAAADAVERAVRVEPDGRQVVQTVSAELEGGGASHTLSIPAGALPGASDLLLKLHPGSFSQVLEGLDNIFSMPYGCFEQTSSATYPNVLVLDYMRRTKQIKPEIELKALKYINLGYQRLLSYEVPGGGFEWFGQTPAHTVLTAYGLMEFSDMARVYDQVDRDVIDRTRRWLLSKQQGDGSWKPPGGGIAEGAINAYRGQQLRTTAYIAWALAESSDDRQPEHQLQRAMGYIARNLGQVKDPYTLAVAANALVAAGRPEARQALSRLAQLKQEQEGKVWWASTSQGVTFSRGNVLQIETTALAAYALIKAGSGISTAHRALSWLVTQKDRLGTFHSTQATVLALRALLLGTGASAKLEGTATVAVSANGQLAKTLTITPETTDVLRLVSLRHLVRQGENAVTITRVGGRGQLAYQLVATHYLPWHRGQRPGDAPPAAKPAEPLTIDVTYDSTRLRALELLTSQVTVRYKRPGVAKMLIVDLGIPPGFAVQPVTFEALKERGLIERYSLTGAQVTLYVRALRADKPLSFQYQLRAKHPVKVKTPRSRVYEYYQPEVKAEARPVELTVL